MAAAWDNMGQVALNKVKLPSPSVSDYVTPSAAAASSIGFLGLIYDYETTTGWTFDTGTDLDGTYKESGSYAGHAYYEGADLHITKDNPIDLTAISELRLWYRCNRYTNIFLEISTDAVFTTPIIIAQNASSGSGTVTGEMAGDVSGYSGNYYIRTRHNGSVTYTWSRDSWADNLAEDTSPPAQTMDEDTASKWRPDPANEAGTWCRWDMGALKICSGCRVYWGADAAYRPTAYRIEVSENGTDWTTVKTETAAAPASAWKEYSWNARYARYIRLIVDTHGASGTEIYEADYYSRITDRVAAEHGHGSGVTPHLKGHGVRKGFTIREVLKNKPTLTPNEIIDYIDFMLGE